MYATYVLANIYCNIPIYFFNCVLIVFFWQVSPTFTNKCKVHQKKCKMLLHLTVIHNITSLTSSFFEHHTWEDVLLTRKLSLWLSMPRHVCTNMPHHNNAAVIQGNECDWLTGRWGLSTAPLWLAVSFWQNTVIMGFIVQQGKIKTQLRLQSEWGLNIHLRTVWHQWTWDAWLHVSWVNVTILTRALHIKNYFSQCLEGQMLNLSIFCSAGWDQNLS